jgi:hypothetical protein
VDKHEDSIISILLKKYSRYRFVKWGKKHVLAGSSNKLWFDFDSGWKDLVLSTTYFDGYSKVSQERLGLCKEKRGKRAKDYSGES